MDDIEGDSTEKKKDHGKSNIEIFYNESLK